MEDDSLQPAVIFALLQIVFIGESDVCERHLAFRLISSADGQEQSKKMQLNEPMLLTDDDTTLAQQPPLLMQCQNPH